jgi:hypothetical protein
MTRRLVGATFLAALVALATLLAPDAPGPEPRSGLEVFSVSYGAWGMARVRVLRFAPQDFELRLLKPTPGKLLQRVALMPGCADAAACFNGPFFKEDRAEPLGLLVTASVIWQPLRSVTWGVFWVDRENRPHIQRHDDFKTTVDVATEVTFAIQSGPTTLLRSQVKKKESTELARRTSIGIDDQGRILVLVANFPVRLAALAEFARDRLAVTDLMNLDGGSSTQLVVAGERHESKVLGFPVAVGVGVYPRIGKDARAK